MECWKDIKRFEGLYEVSNLGKVRSKERQITQVSRAGNRYTRSFPSTILVPRSNSGGYLYVQLCKHGKSKNFAIHRLVAEAFIPNPVRLPEVCHNNGIPSDNQKENLRWDNRLGNEADKEKHGTRYKGDNHYSTKYSDTLILKIKSELTGRHGEKAELAKKYGIPRAYLYDILAERKRK